MGKEKKGPASDWWAQREMIMRDGHQCGLGIAEGEGRRALGDVGESGMWSL